jgi:hypothetical protein
MVADGSSGARSGVLPQAASAIAASAPSTAAQPLDVIDRNACLISAKADTPRIRV